MTRKDYKNYRNYTKKETKVDDVPVVSSGQVDDNTIVIKKVEEKPREGKVTNCTMVNVRLSPSSAAPITTIISCGEIVKIDMEKSTDEFYAVTTSYDIPGFINKDYIMLS